MTSSVSNDTHGSESDWVMSVASGCVLENEPAGTLRGVSDYLVLSCRIVGYVSPSDMGIGLVE